MVFLILYYEYDCNTIYHENFIMTCSLVYRLVLLCTTMFMFIDTEFLQISIQEWDCQVVGYVHFQSKKIMPHFPFKVIVTFFHTYKSNKGYLGSISWPTFKMRSFRFCQFSGYKIAFHRGLICSSLIIDEIEHLFMYTICDSSSVKSLYLLPMFSLWLVFPVYL